MDQLKSEQLVISVVGLGYVGLPLAVEFGHRGLVVNGFDINEVRINDLKNGYDQNNEISLESLKSSKVNFSFNPKIISESNFIIIAVPTPITSANLPDLNLLKKASKLVGQYLKKGSIVVYESTVYPGVTEDVCQPIIEEESKLLCGIDWQLGYSPERVNPGDQEHTINKIIKIVSGNSQDTLDKIAEVYSQVCPFGIHKASGIKVAEAAKVIENIQRDLNIALVNELSLIFQKIGIDVYEVLAAAGTKWNFHQYVPGLVGGHCIGVDPYYLVYKAKEVGYDPQVITAGRRINNYMPFHLAYEFIKALILADKKINDSRVLIMGLSFKDNINDTRNSLIRYTIQELKDHGVHVMAYDPLVKGEESNKEFGVTNLKWEDIALIDGIIVNCGHRQFTQITPEKLLKVCRSNPVIFDTKKFYSKESLISSGFIYKHF